MAPGSCPPPPPPPPSQGKYKFALEPRSKRPSPYRLTSPHASVLQACYHAQEKLQEKSDVKTPLNTVSRSRRTTRHLDTIPRTTIPHLFCMPFLDFSSLSPICTAPLNRPHESLCMSSLKDELLLCNFIHAAKINCVNQHVHTPLALGINFFEILTWAGSCVLQTGGSSTSDQRNSGTERVAMATPFDVVSKHRLQAWAFFSLVMGGFLALCIGTTVWHAHQRNHPPIAMKYLNDPVKIGDISICLTNE